MGPRQGRQQPPKAPRELRDGCAGFCRSVCVVEQDRIENGEQRWQTLGVVEGYLLLLVAHTVRDDEDGTECVRIISARRAEPKERKRYEQNGSL